MVFFPSLLSPSYPCLPPNIAGSTSTQNFMIRLEIDTQFSFPCASFSSSDFHFRCAYPLMKNSIHETIKLSGRVEGCKLGGFLERTSRLEAKYTQQKLKNVQDIDFYSFFFWKKNLLIDLPRSWNVFLKVFFRLFAKTEGDSFHGGEKFRQESKTEKKVNIKNWKEKRKNVFRHTLPKEKRRERNSWRIS